MTFSFKNYVLLSLALFVLTVSYFVNSAQINMRDADIRAFASDMAKISNKTIVLDPRVKGNVTVVSNQDLDAGEAYAVFLAVLRVNGYSAVENNGVVKVIPESGARQDASINNLNKDSLSTEVIRLKQANAKVLSPLLKPLINKQGHITAYEPTNSIIIADYVGNTERIKSILLEIDKNPADTFELIPLQNTSSNEIARILGSMWKGDNQMTKSFTALSVERSNSILLRGQKTVIEQLKGVISKLDSNTSQSSNLKVIYLKYAQAEDLTSILENVALTLEEEQLTSSTGTKKTTNISFHSDTNALDISAQYP